MPIDPYAPCPGGTGKKIKFCCSDLVGELDKIQTMLEGEQRAACLELIEKLETKYPDRACLLSVKTMLETSLGQEGRAEATLGTFLKKHPGNPVALAESALLVVRKEGGQAAVEPLQKAIAASTEAPSAQLYDTIGVVGEALIREGHILAGRGHMILQLGFSGGQDKQTIALLAQLDRAPQLPPLLKDDPTLVPAPEGVNWKTSFDAALALAHRGAWSAASERFYELSSKVGDSPAIWRNIATLRIWLADPLGAIRALRKFAALGVPLDDAVEAESLAQLLDTEMADVVELISVPYPITDMERLLATLAGANHAVKMPIDLSRLGSENEPPPRAAYWLVDQPIPTSGVDITREQVPSVVGQLFAFGKQTDREARIELLAYRGPELAAAQLELGKIAGDSLGAAGPEKASSRASAVQHLLSWNWRLPADTPLALRQSLSAAEYRTILLDKWTKLAQRNLGGKSAEEVASDPAFKIRLLAAILLLEMASGGAQAEEDHNALRQKLGLPALTSLDATGLDTATLPITRLARLAPAQLSDEQLLDAYSRAAHFGLASAIRPLALEAIKRPSLDKAIEKAGVYGQLAELEPDSDRALKYLDDARRSAEAAGKSSAAWDISELALRIEMGDVAEAERLINHLRADHIREPGVAQALYQVLMEAGVIGPDGRPTAAAQSAAEPSGLVVPGATAEPGKIWTPGGDAPAASGGKKPVIWTPG